MSGATYIADYYRITGSLGDAANRELFSRISTFFNGHPGYQRIAQSGSLTDQEAFRVWTAVSAANKFDVVLKWSYTNTWTFWNVANSYGVGIIVGAHPSGLAWSGSRNDSGDSKPDVLFKTGSIVMSRQSAVGGDYSVQKNYFHLIRNTVNPNTAVVCSGDNDSFCIVLNEGNNTSADSFFYFGKYERVNPNYNFPYMFIGSQTTDWFTQGTTYGSLTSTNGNDACIAFMSASGAATGSLPVPEKVKFDYATHYVTPIAMSSSFLPKILEYPISLTAKETGAEYVGYLNDIRITHNTIGNFSRLYGGNRLVVSQSDAGDRQTITVPWLSSSTMTSGSFFSGSQCLFLTGSDTFGLSGMAGIYVDRLGTTDSIVTVVSQVIQTTSILYRGRSGANYVYQRGSPPAGATDIVIIDEV